MTEYLIEGTVTAWPEGTADISAQFFTESNGSAFAIVDMSTGQYMSSLEAGAGENVWVLFFATVSQPPPDGSTTAIKAFGPFVIDDIGVLQ